MKHKWKGLEWKSDCFLESVQHLCNCYLQTLLLHLLHWQSLGSLGEALWTSSGNLWNRQLDTQKYPLDSWQLLPVQSSLKGRYWLLVRIQKLDYNKIRIMKLPNKLSCFENDDSFIPTSSLASPLPWIFSITRLYQHGSTRKLNFGPRPNGNFGRNIIRAVNFSIKVELFYYEIIVTCDGMVFYRISLLDGEFWRQEKILNGNGLMHNKNGICGRGSVELSMNL